MTKINARIIADSKNMGHRLTTFVVTFPRIILAEFNTHRMFSRNSASSRAIPFKKMVAMVSKNPFIPIAFQKDHSGMQGSEYLVGWKGKFARWAWIGASKFAILTAKILNKFDVTKQLCNRVLEPFMWHTVIVTSSEFENFFALRCPQYSLFYEQIPREFRSKKDFLKFVKQVESPEFKNQYDNLTELDWLKINKGMAEIHIMALAEAMWDAYNESTPKQLQAGEWHIPFGDDITELELNGTFPYILSDKPAKQHFDDLKIKIATARCARVSYTVVGEEGKKPDFVADIKLHDRLIKSGHLSPTEHCGRAMTGDEIAKNALWCNEHIEYGWSGNFRGFLQYRKLIE